MLPCQRCSSSLSRSCPLHPMRPPHGWHPLGEGRWVGGCRCGCACACWRTKGFWSQLAKRKETGGLRSRDSVPGIVGRWLRSSSPEQARVLPGHPGVRGQGPATPGLRPQGGSGPAGIDAYRVSPNERGCIPAVVCQGTFSTGICQRDGRLAGLKSGLGTGGIRDPMARGRETPVIPSPPSDMGYRQWGTSSPCPNICCIPAVANWDVRGLFLHLRTKGPQRPPTSPPSQGPCG